MPNFSLCISFWIGRKQEIQNTRKNIHSYARSAEPNAHIMYRGVSHAN